MYAIDCKSVRNEILEEAKYDLEVIKEIDGETLGLAIIQVGLNEESDIYVRNKIKTCENLGIKCKHIKLKGTVSLKDVVNTIDVCNADPNIHGIILQLPLPKRLKVYEDGLLNRILWYKDVDGLTDVNVMKLWGGSTGIRPATAEAVMRLLPKDLSDKTVTILGRSRLVGKPLIKMLLDRDATVCVCHSKTPAIRRKSCMTASDIVISAVGKPGLINGEDVRFSTTIIDVGITKTPGGKVKGDLKVLDEDGNVYKGNSSYTPVPGGVGILTTAQIVSNLVKCYRIQNEGGVIWDL